MFPNCQASAPTHIVAASGPFGTPWICVMCESVPPDGGGRAGDLESGQCQACPPRVRPVGATSAQDGRTDRRLASVAPLVRRPPGTCPAHSHRGTRLEGQQPLHTQRSAGPLTSRTFLCQPSGLGMSAGRVATRPWASKTQCLPHRQKASSARHYPCQDTGSAELATAFYNKWKPGSELTQPWVVGARTEAGLRAPMPEADFLGSGNQTCSWESAMSPKSPNQGPSLPRVKWGNAPTRLPCSQGPGEGGTVSLVTDTETEARRPLPWSPVPCRRGLGGPRPQLAHHLLACFLWGQPVGTGHISASRPPGGCLLGGLVSGLRCRTAGSSASSHSRLHGSRGSVTPQGPMARQAGWPSGCGQARPAVMPPPMSLGRLGRPGVSTGTFPTAPSRDPCAHPAGYGPGLPCWHPSGVQRLR